MTTMRVLLAAIASVWTCMAQADDIAISGTVVDTKTTKPVAGASVSLKKNGLRAVSGPDGTFLLSRNTTKAASPSAPSGGSSVNDKTGITTGGSNDSTGLTAKSPDSVCSEAGFDDVIQVNCDGYLDYRQNCTGRDTAGMVFALIASAGTVTDIDGNVYQTVKIGNQVWMTENLRTTRFADGSPIPLIKDSATWLATEKTKKAGYCFLNNTIDKDSIIRFGALYNWHAVNPKSRKKIAPVGWHVATDEDWKILENHAVFISYNQGPPLNPGAAKNSTNRKEAAVKTLASKVGWSGCTTPGTVGFQTALNNQTGFAATPTGSRCCDANFYYGGIRGKWWSPAMNDRVKECFRYLDNGLDALYKAHEFGIGVSVRLVKDNPK
ncbi:MAG: hypothetical protein JW795_04440 [Chitinivibrionales bacterium]|nr:hypothetical protein [Chitinivibrionales bacterium]